MLDEAPQATRMLVMVQREVGERLAASPGTKSYGVPSVKVGYWAEARVVGTVGADVFHPRPRVTSALVEIVRRPAPVRPVDPEVLFDLVRQGFGQRRKTLRRALEAKVRTWHFDAAQVDPNDRAERIDVDGWCRLADAVSSRR